MAQSLRPFGCRKRVRIARSFDRDLALVGFRRTLRAAGPNLWLAAAVARLWPAAGLAQPVQVIPTGGRGATISRKTGRCVRAPAQSCTQDDASETLELSVVPVA
jgi:hypothetical protein